MPNRHQDSTHDGTLDEFDKSGAKKPHAFEDLMKTLLEKKGRFQLILLVLLSLNSMLVGINHTITTFHTYVPDFHCRVGIKTDLPIFIVYTMIKQ